MKIYRSKAKIKGRPFAIRAHDGPPEILIFEATEDLTIDYVENEVPYTVWVRNSKKQMMAVSQEVFKDFFYEAPPPSTI